MRSTHIARNISRMLDLGGMPSAATSKNVLMDASKNCKVRCLAFDFDLLTRTTVNESSISAPNAMGALGESQQRPVSPILPDISMLQQMANLLNVKLGGSVTSSKQVGDDLSALHQPSVDGDKKGTAEKSPSNPVPGNNDIRNKYAAKLRNRGGVAGIELAKQEADDSTLRGDAAGHLVARAMAVKAGSSETPKWMALTGTGALLQYVSTRSMKIALLPRPGNRNAEQEGKRMEEFTKQIPQVTFDVLLKEGDEHVPGILQSLLGQLALDPLTCLVISDRDDYLRSAKEAGMTTCRVRSHVNAPRGNTTAHYTVTSMAEVQDVVNEINGISFKAIGASTR
jgi:hypothetical protein